MTRAEFDANPPVCKFCNGETHVMENKHHPGGGAWCKKCGRLQFWLAKDRAEYHRPAFKRGTTEQVWNAWHNHCACCGLSESELDFLGITKTTQHVPPFKEVGHDSFYIPFCSWCQQFSASQMKRLQSLVERLRGAEQTA